MMYTYNVYIDYELVKSAHSADIKISGGRLVDRSARIAARRKNSVPNWMGAGVDYAAGVNAGFMVSPSPLQSCDIATVGSCAPSQTLTIGLNGSVETGFSEVKLNCPPSNYSGPDNIDGYAVCQMGIPDTTVTVSGAASGVLAGTVLFDSGTPSMVLNVPAGSAFPPSVPSGSSVMVATPSGFTFSYTGGSGSEVTNTIVQPGSTAESIVGIGYFTTKSFFIDFTSGTEGWK
jgi:hypothetical protein